MTKIYQYVHRPNSTELGKGNTHETYLLIRKSIDLSHIFPVGVNVPVVDACRNKTYYLKAASGSEYRVNQMGQLYRDYSVEEGDEIQFTKLENSSEITIFVKVNIFNRIIITIDNKGTEMGNIWRLSNYGSKAAGYRIPAITYTGSSYNMSIKFDAAKKKRSDSPDKTDYYITKIDDILLENGTYALDLDTKELSILHKCSYNEVTIEDDELLRIISHRTKPVFNNMPLQKIYYGSPGTGKSYKVEHDELEGVNEDFIFRTTFHPDSDYSSFVGAYKPLKKDDSITYDFEPQAFTNAYVKAWQNPAEQVYLVIEEINRGNCAQIFGDLFQLLDRKNGVSEYPVNADAALAKYLKETLKEDAAEGIANGKLKIPANLNIIATMNTSDQSLFPMDSAFKRRWDWVYIPTTPPANKEKNMTLHIGETNADYNGQAITVGDYEYKWTEFLKAINKRISAVTHSDDKQLGFWFVKTPEGQDEISVSTFVSKVIFYLWNDIFKDISPSNRNNPFGIKVKDAYEIMTFNSFFEINSDNEIVENIGVLHTFMRNLGLGPKLNKEIEAAQQETDLQDESVQQ